MNKELDVLMLKYYNEIMDIVSPSFFSINFHNNWLFIILGVFCLISSFCLFFWIEEELDYWFKNKQEIMKNRYGFEFLNLSKFNIKSEMPKKSFKLSNNSEVDYEENRIYSRKLKDFKLLNLFKFIYKFILPINVTVFILSIVSLFYGTFYLWFSEDSFVSKSIKNHYNEVKDDYILEEESEIINVKYFETLKSMDLIEEYGDTDYKKLSLKFLSYGTIDEDLPVYLFNIKTKDGKYEKLYIYEKDINAYEAKSDIETKKIKYKDYGSRYNFTSDYIDYLDYFGGIKDAKIYLSESELSNYLEGKPLFTN